MSHVPHQLAEEFPQHAERLQALKQSDAHFRRLAEAYDEVNRAIHRAETQIEPVDPFIEEDMRKRRLILKDEIYGMLAAKA